MWIRNRVRRVAVLAAWGAIAAWPVESRGQRPTPDETVARVEQQTLSRAEIEARINGQVPEVRRKYRSLEARRQFVDRQIDLELLAAEARRRGLEADPEVRRVIAQALAHRLLELEAESVAPPEEERVQAFWEANSESYSKPATRRVAHLLLEPRKNGGRRRTKKRAEAYYEEAAANRENHEHFRQLVANHSDDADTRLRGGDLRYFTREEPSIPEKVRELAFDSMDLGDLALCESPLGFHIIKLIGRRGASTPGLEDVRDRVVRSLMREDRARVGERLVEALRRNAAVEINEKALRRVKVERP